MKLHRTSSSRKLRRKNDMARDWSDLRSSLQESQGLDQGKPEGDEWAWRGFGGKRWILSNVQYLIVLGIGLGCGAGYYYYVSCLFENSTRFSHLTNAERELSLPADVAFRYSYFKKMATSSSYIEGIRTITGDGGNGTASSFHRYSLATESLYAGVFHLFKLSAWVFGLSLGECTIVYPNNQNTGVDSVMPLSERGGMAFGLPRLGGKSGWDFQGGYNDHNLFNSSCSGLRDPLEFYLAFTWALEGLVVILVFFTGHQFSCSIFGGICSVALFGLVHPQRTNYNCLFPSPEKVGWIFAFTQIYTIGQTVFSHVHPSWRAAPKIAVSSGLLILFWNTDSQWFLLSQLLIVTALHVFGYFSRYVTSLIVFGQFTGWQYATLVSLDPAMHHWSLFLYVLVATIATVFIAEPVIDWILGDKSCKWSFMRRTILVFVFQLALFSARCDLGRHLSLLEDIRFPLSLTLLPDGVTNWADVDPDFEDDGTDESGSEADHVGKFDTFLRLCFLSKVRSTPFKFLCKYFFLIFAGLYSLLTALILPSLTLNMSSGSGAMKLGYFGNNSVGNNMKTTSFTTAVQSGGGKSEGKLIKKEKDEDQLEKEKRERKERKDYEWYWKRDEGLWDAFLVYNMVQTLAFSLLAIYVDKRWEMFFVPHICLIISCLCDFKKVSRGIKALPIKYSYELHVGIWISILGIIIASARVRSHMMHLKSRGRFEIGNPRVVNLVEALQWIEGNVGLEANFTGADNLMVAMKMLTPRSTVTTPLHLTVHSWANIQGRRRGKGGGESGESGRKSGTAEGSSADSGKDATEDEMMSRNPDDDDKYGDSKKLMYKSGLQREELGRRLYGSKRIKEEDGRRENLFESDSVRKEESELISIRNPQLWMTSRLGNEERTSLLKVYSVYSRRKSIVGFHEDLLSIRVTHLFLSQGMCASSKNTAAAAPRQILSGLQTKGAPQYTGKPVSSKVLGASLGKEGTGRGSTAQLIFQPEEMVTRNTSLAGSCWHWEWNWQEPFPPDHNGECQEWHLSPISHLKLCDMTYFWDTIERPQGKPMEANERSVSDRVSAIRKSIKFARIPDQVKSGKASMENSEEKADTSEDEPLLREIMICFARKLWR